MKPARVVTIIVNWNGGDVTLNCLQALIDTGIECGHIAVVDNGSTDGSANLLRAHFPNMIVLEANRNLGFARAVNLGISRLLTQLTPEYVFLLNNDAFVNASTIPSLMQALEAEPAAGAATPKIYYADSRRLWYGGGKIDWHRGTGRQLAQGEEDRGQADRPGRTEFATCCALLVRADLISSEGVFDERYYFMGEDVDLSLRLARAGRVILYVPGATVIHRVGASSAKQGNAFIWYHMTRNRLLTVHNHATPGQKLRFWMFWPALWLIKASSFALSGQMGVVQAMFQAIVDFRGRRFNRVGPVDRVPV